MVIATEGNWWIENVQIGTGTTRQRRGVMVTGPAQVTLKDVTFRTRSQSDAAIYAERGGLALLRGAIRINEHLHQNAPEESFAGIIATDHGTVRFDGSTAHRSTWATEVCSASYYGCIGLGCKTARITSWGDQVEHARDQQQRPDRPAQHDHNTCRPSKSGTRRSAWSTTAIFGRRRADHY